MKRFYSIIVSLCFLISALQAQMNIDGNILYGNEWIDYSQNYYKVYVKADGVYQIPYQALASAGVPVNTVAAENIQVFTMGKEVPIYVSTSGALGTNGYIEFYGEKNKGDMDKHIYRSHEDAFNPYYSMYTDTAAYFITWNSSTNNKRLTETPNDLDSTPAPEEFFMHTSVALPPAGQMKFNKGESISDLYESTYSPGEGFGSNYFTSKTYTVSTPDIYSGVGSSEFWIRFAASGSGDTHQTSITINGTSLSIDSAGFVGYRFRQINEDIPTSLLGASTTDVIISGTAGATDKYATAFAQISYPREFKFGNANTFKFTLPAGDPGQRRYLQILEFDHGGNFPILYDLTNGQRIVAAVAGTAVLVALPPAAGERELVLVNPTVAETLDTAFEIDFVDYSVNEGDFILATNKAFLDDGAGNNYVQDYADYRAATGYNPIIVDVEELYDQFSYGVNKHVQAIRNFTGYSIENWTQQPKYFFMIGKSRPHYSTRTNPIGQPSFTPTFGHEPSDNLLTATSTNDIPRIPFGRIPVLRADEVRIYLDKVMAYESNQQNLPQTIEDKARLKRVIHLGGGDVAIQNTIKNNLGDYEETARDDFWGAEVTSFFKNSSDPIQISTSALLDSLIDDGTSLITFYGHSSPESFDFNLDDPETYTNTDRYFALFSLGCYSGQIHQKLPNLGERFVFAEDKGAIAFLATVSLSGLGSLDVFADNFYEKVSRENYGQGLGDIIQATIEELFLAGTGPSTRIVYQQMTLNGDPSIRLNTATAPDYIVNKPTINFEPAEPTTADDIDITFSVTNIGRTSPNQFRILIERILPSGTEIAVIDELVDSPKYEKEYSYTIPASNEETVGLNKFRITVDAAEQIAEAPTPIAEDNNVEIADVYVFTDDVSPVYPYDFSIAGTASEVVLKASTANVFADELTYYMEIDTTENFNSPLKQNTSITQGGGLLEWKPSIAFIDSTVYYWRVQVDPTQVPDAAGWKNRSFVYIDGEYPGWNQSHYYQFNKDRFANVKYLSDRRFEFVDDNIELVVNNAHIPILSSTQIDYSINGSRIFDVEGCEVGQQGMYLVLLDANVAPLENEQTNGSTQEGLYGSQTCAGQVPAFFFPTNTSLGRNKLRDFFTLQLPSLPQVKHILIYSLNDYLPEDWNQDLFDAFSNQGVTQLPSTTSLGGVPYAALIDLDAGTYDEVLGNSETDIIEAVFTVIGSWDSGSVISTLIGPASEWGSVHWRVTEQEPNDTVRINIYGINAGDQQTLLYGGLVLQDYVFNGTIDANQYPYLRLEYDIADPTNTTATQLEYWRVIYEELPDVALRPDLFYVLEGDTIQQGEDLHMKIAVENISQANMDSLLMSYSVINSAGNTVVTDRLKPLMAGDSLIAAVDLETRTFSGPYQLVVFANPDEDQREQTLANNIGITSFYVRGDRLNPILDVTFDGQHILDGDIVSAKPNIVISLKDENQNLELADTSLFKILMKYPGESSLRQISFNSPAITFYPADPNRLDEENRAAIEFNPTLLNDGTYQLFVQAEDASGNQSGDLDYKVSFVVISEPAISNVLNYPNPFTTSTRFVFTLTGSELPDYMKIQIMTVTGKVVREITMDELGDLHIGNNISDFAWDGTDQYGDQLANGVYLYRVVTKTNGAEYDRFPTNNTNQYFKNGYGKMYLMR